MSDIGDALRGARAYLTDHPDEARYRDSPATARMVGGLATEVEGPDGVSLRTDMPAGIGGGASAPSPGWYLRAAQASCVATLVTMRAAEEGVALDHLVVTVDSESDDRGITGAADDIPAGPLSGRVKVMLGAAGADEATLRSIAEWGWQHCPVDDAIRRAVRVDLEIEVGSTET
jgi:uncharacterized OsmC-like protein